MGGGNWYDISCVRLVKVKSICFNYWYHMIPDVLIPDVTSVVHKIIANLYVLNSVASYNTSTIYSMMKIILSLNLTGK